MDIKRLLNMLKQLFSFKPIRFKKLKLDLELILLLLILLGIGIIFIYSSSAVEGLSKYNDANFFIKKHIVLILASFIVLLIAATIDFRSIISYLPHLNVITLILMLLTYNDKFSVTANGATRWIEIFGFQFQPSEMAKMTFILTLSYIIADKYQKGTLNKFKEGILPILIYIFLYSIIVLLQKHMSAAGVFIFISFVALIAGGIYFRYILMTIPFIAALMFYAITNEAFRLERIFAFLNPEKDPIGSGYQVLQSFYALGSGEWFGVGVGLSKQKFGWLPEPYNDFIVAIIGEELGFVGIFILLVITLIFIIKMLIIVVSTENHFNFVLSISILGFFFFQILINLMVVTGLFPVTGMSFPFISYGGTNLITSMFLIGIIMNIASQNQNKEKN